MPIDEEQRDRPDQVVAVAEELAREIIANPASSVAASLEVVETSCESGEIAAQELAATRLAELMGASEMQAKLDAFAARA